MRLQPESEHPHGLPDSRYDALFPADRTVIFAHHGYPSLIHRLTYRRANHQHFHVRCYKEGHPIWTREHADDLSDVGDWAWTQ